jgi:hypothetical protein
MLVLTGLSDGRDWKGGVLLVSGLVAALAAGTSVINVRKGSVLPEGGFVVVAVPFAALHFYLLVVRRRRDR